MTAEAFERKTFESGFHILTILRRCLGWLCRKEHAELTPLSPQERKMNDIVPTISADSGSPLTFGSPAMAELVARVAEGSAERDRDRTLPFEVLKLVRQTKLGALRLPLTQGGGGSSLTEFFDVVIGLAEADPNVTHILRNHFAFVEKALRSSPSDPYRSWLPLVADGAVFSAGFSELGSSNAGQAKHQTNLQADGPDYILNGTKYYSTGALYADYIAVSAVDGDGASVTAIVPSTRSGVHLDDDWDGIGQRLTGTGTTRLIDVRVKPQEVIFHARHAGHLLPYQATFPQLYLTAIIAGILRAVTNDAKALLRRRGRNYYHATAERPTEDPILHLLLGQIASNAYAAEAIVLNAAAALDRASASAVDGIPDEALVVEASLRAAKAKVVVDEIAIRTSAQIFDVGGASAAKQSHQLDRHWRNIRTLASHNPDSYKARAIGDHVLNGTVLPLGSFF
jgi:alkylation response protein AidB-like acyl-CoA dehydrogenase